MPLSSCCSIQQGCVDAAPVLLDEEGIGFHDNMVDSVSYFGMSPFTGCAGTTFVPCQGIGILSCNPPFSPFGFGTVSVLGYAPTCRTIREPGFPGERICNETTIQLYISNELVTVTSGDGSTAASVARDLSDRINAHPTLRTKVGAVASNNLVYIRSLQEGIDFAYPWRTSCYYDSEMFNKCDFRAQVAPICTMGTRPPL